MPRYIDQSDINFIFSKLKQKGILPAGVLAGYITNGGSLPTTRPDGNKLENYDYVHVDENSTLPFTIDGFEITALSDILYYDDDRWYLCKDASSIAAMEAKRYAEDAGKYATQAGNSAVEAITAAAQAKNVVWKGTREEYNQLSHIDPNCIYFITNEKYEV